jgi:hypothetical protein
MRGFECSHRRHAGRGRSTGDLGLGIRPFGRAPPDDAHPRRTRDPGQKRDPMSAQRPYERFCTVASEGPRPRTRRPKDRGRGSRPSGGRKPTPRHPGRNGDPMSTPIPYERFCAVASQTGPRIAHRRAAARDGRNGDGVLRSTVGSRGHRSCFRDRQRVRLALRKARSYPG